MNMMKQAGLALAVGLALTLGACKNETPEAQQQAAEAKAAEEAELLAANEKDLEQFDATPERKALSALPGWAIWWAMAPTPATWYGRPWRWWQTATA